MTVADRIAALEDEVRMLRGLMFGYNADGSESDFIMRSDVARRADGGEEIAMRIVHRDSGSIVQTLDTRILPPPLPSPFG